MGKNSVRGEGRGRRGGGGVCSQVHQNDVFFGVFYYYNMGILVILTPKMTFWVFRPFSPFHLTDGAIL